MVVKQKQKFWWLLSELLCGTMSQCYNITAQGYWCLLSGQIRTHLVGSDHRTAYPTFLQIFEDKGTLKFFFLNHWKINGLKIVWASNRREKWNCSKPNRKCESCFWEDLFWSKASKWWYFANKVSQKSKAPLSFHLWSKIQMQMIVDQWCVGSAYFWLGL